FLNAGDRSFPGDVTQSWGWFAVDGGFSAYSNNTSVCRLTITNNGHTAIDANMGYDYYNDATPPFSRLYVDEAYLGSPALYVGGGVCGFGGSFNNGSLFTPIYQLDIASQMDGLTTVDIGNSQNGTWSIDQFGTATFVVIFANGKINAAASTASNAT